MTERCIWNADAAVASKAHLALVSGKGNRIGACDAHKSSISDSLDSSINKW